MGASKATQESQECPRSYSRSRAPARSSEGPPAEQDHTAGQLRSAQEARPLGDVTCLPGNPDSGGQGPREPAGPNRPAKPWPPWTQAHRGQPGQIPRSRTEPLPLAPPHGRHVSPWQLASLRDPAPRLPPTDQDQDCCCGLENWTQTTSNLDKAAGGTVRGRDGGKGKTGLYEDTDGEQKATRPSREHAARTLGRPPATAFPAQGECPLPSDQASI